MKYIVRVDRVKLIHKLQKLRKVLFIFVCVGIVSIGIIFILLSSHLVHIHEQHHLVSEQKIVIF